VKAIDSFLEAIAVDEGHGAMLELPEPHHEYSTSCVFWKNVVASGASSVHADE
jgi:hypothetical protein